MTTDHTNPEQTLTLAVLDPSDKAAQALLTHFRGLWDNAKLDVSATVTDRAAGHRYSFTNLNGNEPEGIKGYSCDSVQDLLRWQPAGRVVRTKSTDPVEDIESGYRLQILRSYEKDMHEIERKNGVLEFGTIVWDGEAYMEVLDLWIENGTKAKQVGNRITVKLAQKGYPSIDGETTLLWKNGHRPSEWRYTDKNDTWYAGQSEEPQKAAESRKNDDFVKGGAEVLAKADESLNRRSDKKYKTVDATSGRYRTTTIESNPETDCGGQTATIGRGFRYLSEGSMWEIEDLWKCTEDAQGTSLTLPGCSFKAKKLTDNRKDPRSAIWAAGQRPKDWMFDSRSERLVKKRAKKDALEFLRKHTGCPWLSVVGELQETDAINPVPITDVSKMKVDWRIDCRHGPYWIQDLHSYPSELLCLQAAVDKAHDDLMKTPSEREESADQDHPIRVLPLSKLRGEIAALWKLKNAISDSRKRAPDGFAAFGYVRTDLPDPNAAGFETEPYDSKNAKKRMLQKYALEGGGFILCDHLAETVEEHLVIAPSGIYRYVGIVWDSVAYIHPAG